MLTYSEAFYDLKTRLQPLYDEREAAAIAHELISHITKLNKMQRLTQKETGFTVPQQQQYEDALNELLKGTPLQYVVHTAWFLGREYYVNKHVLIPRPETEELVQWIVDESLKSKLLSLKSISINAATQFPTTNSQPPVPKPQILDIGTGNGCIPISLKLALSDAEITSCDISNDALDIARENAHTYHADIQFLQTDFLDPSQHNKLSKYDVIVSNPPYIPVSEKERLHRNVKDFEPGMALFVPDDDALIFYKAIASFGKEHLNSNGYIYCELDAGHAIECKALFEEAGYKDVTIRKDMHGNWRMLKAGRVS